MQLFLQQANTIQAEILKNRRTVHRFAEVGFELPQTKEFVFHTLTEYGYQPKYVGASGIVATVGKAGKTFLLRADMDALPIREESELDFAAVNGNHHACGHDLHTAMLLGAAKLLKQRESELAGTVKLMFQPAEELLSGAKDMVNHGLLQNPTVDAALALHAMVGRDDSQTGNICYTTGTVTNSGDAFRITVQGEDAHGSTPYLGVDAIQIAANIITAFQGIVAKEIPSNENTVLLVGKIEGGTTCNTVAGHAVLEVSLRTGGKKQREFAIKRIKETATGIASVFRGKVEIEHMYGSPALVNDKELVEELIGYIREIREDAMLVPECKIAGGEDFSIIAEQLPSAFFMLGAGSLAEGYPVSVHNPITTFNEEILPLGAAIYAGCAYRWLDEHQ